MKPTTQQWSNLFEAAKAFKQAACWDWMDNIHLFGVKHPDTKQVGYCCIMGSGGEMFALAVYLGAPGLRTVMEMLAGQLKEDPMYAQHCLMLCFDDREDLYPEEKARIKELGLKFRGRQAWPTFRLFEPGFYPWPLQTGNEVMFLTAAIEQAIVVSQASKADPDALLAPRFLTRVGTRQADGSLSWHSELMDPEEDEDSVLPELPVVNELHMVKLKKTIQKRGGTWELGLSYMPAPIMDGGRPYYPMIFLVIDQASGQILSMELCEKSEMTGAAMEKFISLLEQIKFAPAEMVATDDKVYEYLDPVITALDLKCYLTKRLPMLEQAQEELFAHMGMGR